VVPFSKILNFITDELNIDFKIISPSDYSEDMKIINMKSDDDAQVGDMSWISKKVVKYHPERINNFKGSLLFIPHSQASISSNSILIESNNPKYVFLMVATNFFSDILVNHWNQGDELNTCLDTKIGESVQLAPGVVLGSNIKIEDNVIIGPNTVINNCCISKNVKIGANCSIGLDGFGFDKNPSGEYYRFPHIGKVIIEENVEIGNNTCIDRGALSNTIIHSGVKIDNLVHIAHNVEIGKNTLIIANSMIGGSSVIEENVWVAPSSSIMNQINIGENSIIGLGAVVLDSVQQDHVMVGNPATSIKDKRK
tara:strand:+ start:189 stop:1118 length:930 start_codon:yes stop_codon:yes gene_type:complete